MEAVITGLVDEYKILNKRKELFVLGACLLCFLPGITHVTQVMIRTVEAILQVIGMKHQTPIICQLHNEIYRKIDILHIHRKQYMT